MSTLLTHSLSLLDGFTRIEQYHLDLNSRFREPTSTPKEKNDIRKNLVMDLPPFCKGFSFQFFPKGTDYLYPKGRPHSSLSQTDYTVDTHLRLTLDIVITSQVDNTELT